MGIFPRYSGDDVAYDAANFDFNEVDYENRHAVEILYQGRIDYRTPIAIGDDSTIKFGVKATQRNKTNNEDVTVYDGFDRSEEHTSELQPIMRRSYAVFCLNKQKEPITTTQIDN